MEGLSTYDKDNLTPLIIDNNDHNPKRISIFHVTFVYIDPGRVDLGNTLPSGQ